MDEQLHFAEKRLPPDSGAVDFKRDWMSDEWFVMCDQSD